MEKLEHGICERRLKRTGSEFPRSLRFTNGKSASGRTRNRKRKRRESLAQAVLGSPPLLSSSAFTPLGHKFVTWLTALMQAALSCWRGSLEPLVQLARSTSHHVHSMDLQTPVYPSFPWLASTIPRPKLAIVCRGVLSPLQAWRLPCQRQDKTDGQRRVLRRLVLCTSVR
ncbi:hypothetical protein B0T22DRAFT_245399 [Podospora appendiculata]|uniref:Uncharacterized protein n=1 Tax=Podospora appendiculata TaxID=314037 RepID=A0AAE0X2L2_9PEZI|nr:hypothetical protein B0T22DRAFT_245399 [Podospora appendiculata]